MNTTDLFVEIIVIGVGTIIGLLFLLFSIFGIDWLPLNDVVSLAVAIPLLTIIYVLGIVMDRISDKIFDTWKKGIQKKYYNESHQDYNDRRYIYANGGRLVDLLEYGRSRIRICRGWTVNAILILFTSNLFIWIQLSGTWFKIKLSLFSILFFFLIAVGTAYSWYQLTSTDYRKVKSQSKYLRSLHSK